MAGIEELGRVLGENIKDKDNMKSNILRHGTENTYFLLARYYLKVRSVGLIVQSRTIGTAFILGHASNGVLGTSALGAGTQGAWSTIETLTAIQRFTNVGRYEIAKWLNSNADASNEDVAADPEYFAFGTDNTAFSESAIAMGTEKIRKSMSTDSTSTGFATLLAEIKSTDRVVGDVLKEVGLMIDGRTASRINTAATVTTVNVTLGVSA